MTIDELKQELEQKTGVPATLLHGESAEENIAQCKALLAYKRDQGEQSTAVQFADWSARFFGEQTGHEKAEATLFDIEERLRAEAGFINVRDGGEVDRGEKTYNLPPISEFDDWGKAVLYETKRKLY